MENRENTENVMDAINDLVQSASFENGDGFVVDTVIEEENFLEEEENLDLDEVSVDLENIDSFESLSVERIVEKKLVREIFNIYSDELELKRACDSLLDRADTLGVFDVVNGYVEDFLEKRKKKQDALEEKNRRLKWHMEVKARREEEERRRLRRKLEREHRAELEELKRVEREEARKKEYAEIRMEFASSLDDACASDIIEHRFTYKSNGELEQNSVLNYDLIVQNDKFLKSHLKYNEFINNLEYDGEVFTNGDLLNIISYIDRVYKLHDEKLIWNALNRPGNVERYHPIKDIIEYEEWDKTPRIDEFFQKVCNVSITDENSRIYYREVARMLFYGGIKRLYEPGCKFDYMIILKGRQGTCKTTLVRLLALDDSAYSEVTSIDGSVGVESIKGSWICEFAELLAMVRAREVESIKAFVTRQFDKYRAPYARVAEVVPRSCIFIGTTNEIQFMGDMTGNRRYLPVEVHTDATDFFEKLEENQKYILECWREAFYMYMNDKIYTTIPAEYFNILEGVRDRYVDDNPMVGLISGYLEQLPVGYDICGLEIFIKALNGNRSKFTSRDSRNIATIMSSFPNWVRYEDRKYFSDDGYGRQRYWKKVGE